MSRFVEAYAIIQSRCLLFCIALADYDEQVRFRFCNSEAAYTSANNMLVLSTREVRSAAMHDNECEVNWKSFHIVSSRQIATYASGCDIRANKSRPIKYQTTGHKRAMEMMSPGAIC